MLGYYEIWFVNHLQANPATPLPSFRSAVQNLKQLPELFP
jgi:hypothetical protein